MKPERDLSCARAQVLLEPFLDGDLSVARRLRLERHLAACAACRVELEAAENIQSELRALPRFTCPDVVAEFVLRQAEASRPRSVWSRWRESLADVVGASVWRPAAALAGVAAVVLTIVLLAQQPRLNGYTPHELARAEVEARYAFAIVAQVTTRASDTALDHVVGGVVRDVMGSQVFMPITDAVQKPFSKPRQEKETQE